MMRRGHCLVVALLAVGVGGASFLTDGTLRSVASMDVARAAHTMTPLPDGRVLVVGGFGAPDQNDVGAVLFDPVSMRFTSVSSPLQWRHSHSATLLPSGLVLLAGGYGPGNRYLNSAELFDPRDGSSRRVGDLLESRAGHVAVPLSDGRVLVAGGVGDGWTYLASAEVFDPVTERFESTGSMNTARESHTAVELRDGRVLVAGGHGGTRRDLRVFDSAELYDPTDGRFSAVGNMTIRRHKHDAIALADGQILVLGGANERDSRGVYNSTELFDPNTLSFREHAPMQYGRYKLAGSTVLLDDGRLLVAGGARKPEVYEPKESRFKSISTAESLAGLFSAVARLPDGRVLISGGYSAPGGATEGAWVFSSN